MAEKNTADIGFEKQIWDAACVLRGNMDASEFLKKYKYPPEDYDFAISTVISQCELWTDNVEPQREERLYKYVSEVELSKVAEDSVPYRTNDSEEEA